MKKAAVFDDLVKHGRLVFFHNTKKTNNSSASSQGNSTKETRENSEESLRYVKQ